MYHTHSLLEELEKEPVWISNGALLYSKGIFLSCNEGNSEQITFEEAIAIRNRLDKALTHSLLK